MPEKICTNCVSKEEKIQKIISIEWAMFDWVNKGKGRASCQDDPETFVMMRQSQFDAWSEELIDSYLSDLLVADAKGINLIELKYIYMMCGIRLEEFMEHANYPGKENRVITKKIMKIMNAWSEQVMREFPTLQLYSRPFPSNSDTYLCVSFSLPPRYKNSSQLPTRLSQESLNRAFSWLMFWMMMLQ